MFSLLADLTARLRAFPRRERPPHDTPPQSRKDPFRFPYSRKRRPASRWQSAGRWAERFHRCRFEQCEQRVLLTFHLWKIDQVFSSADGKVQFIELHDPANGENHTSGHFISSNENKFTFPTDLSSDATANQHFLIATADYAALPGAAKPDYIIPDNFFNPAGDSFDYADVDAFSFTANQVPTDGMNALFRDVNSGNLSTGKNSESNLAGQTASITVTATPPSQPPTLDTIVDPAAVLEGTTQPTTVNLTGISAGPGATQTITISAASDNTALVNNLNVNYTSPNATGSVSFVPVAGAFGTATVTVTAKDGGGTTSRTFHVTVTHVNQSPTINPIADPAPILPGSPQQTVNLTGIGAGPNETQNITITAQSSNPALIPNPQVNYSSPNASGTLTYTPVAGVTGSATITVTVKDDGGTANSGHDSTVVKFNVLVGQTQQQLFVQHAVEDILGREPTAADIQQFNGQLTSGSSREDVARSIFNSNEHLQELVNSLYQKLLGRSADAGGMSFWTQLLGSGTDETAVTAGIAGSDEFFSRVGATNQAFVEALYHDLLGRNGEQAGVAFWAGSLANGSSHADVARGFTTSHEFHGLLVDDPASLFTALQGWFQNYFHRNADQAGLAFFQDQLDASVNSAQLQLQMLATDEYFNRTT